MKAGKIADLVKVLKDQHQAQQSIKAARQIRTFIKTNKTYSAASGKDPAPVLSPSRPEQIVTAIALPKSTKE